MNTLILFLFILGLQGLLYQAIYPRFVQSNLRRLVLADLLATLLIFTCAGLKFWGTGAGFDFGLFKTNWFLAALLITIAIESFFFNSYCKRFNLDLTKITKDRNSPGESGDDRDKD